MSYYKKENYIKNSIDTKTLIKILTKINNICKVDAYDKLNSYESLEEFNGYACDEYDENDFQNYLSKIDTERLYESILLSCSKDEIKILKSLATLFLGFE